MKGEHEDRGDQHAGGEQFLPDTFRRSGDHVGKSGHYGGANDACPDAAADREPSARESLRRSHNDADDEAGLEHFTENDEKRGEHFD